MENCFGSLGGFSYICLMDSILTIKELVELYDRGELEGEYFICYPTELHRKEDSGGYIPRTEIEAMSKWNKEYEKKLFKILWGVN